MGVTFFDLKPNKRQQTKQVSAKQEPDLVELEKVVVPARAAYMTYVDADGQERIASGAFSKDANGTYIMSNTEIDMYQIEEKTVYTYRDIDPHFAYIDNKGKERTFNRLDTLRYNEETYTYTGEVGNIEYIETEVELFTK